jgi:hypothetical protein
MGLVRAAVRALGHAVPAPRGSTRRGRPARVGVYSGWIGPDGLIEEAPGTVLHVARLARFGEPTTDGVFAKGAVRYVTPRITSVWSSGASTPSRSDTRSRP